LFVFSFHTDARTTDVYTKKKMKSLIRKESTSRILDNLTRRKQKEKKGEEEEDKKT